MSPHVFRDMRFSEKRRYRAPEKFYYITGGGGCRRKKGFPLICTAMTGIHLTANAYVPTYLLKNLSATEYRGELSLGILSENYFR